MKILKWISDSDYDYYINKNIHQDFKKVFGI